MTITDRLRPYLREAAAELAGGDIVGLCGLNYKHFDGTPEYSALAKAIRHRIAHPTSAAWKQYRPWERYVYAVKNLLPPSWVADVVWHRVDGEYRVIGALRWYRWALRTCQLADRMTKKNPNARCNSKTLAQRFADGKPGKCHNASVSVVQCEDHTEVSYRLHDTTILRGKKYPGDTATRLHLLSWGGWMTVTTQKHMNNVLTTLGLPTVSRRTWDNCPRTVSTLGSDYVVHWADYRRRAYHVSGLVLPMDRNSEQPLADLLGWLHRCDKIAVQRLSEYDFSQGMGGSMPTVVEDMLGGKRRKVYYNGPRARFTGVTK